MKQTEFSNCINDWLDDFFTPTNSRNYAHRLLKEKSAFSPEILKDLKKIIGQAHQDAKNRLRKVSNISLDPLTSESFDPAEGYPDKLPLTTLKGYFGEALAGVVAEHFTHFDEDSWHVPAYSFRFHDTAFDYLEKLRQGTDVPGAIVGRTGDDTCAFLMDVNGNIISSLVCEAKCTSRHDLEMVKKAHRQISDPLVKPIEIRRVIEILLDYDEQESITWREALYRLYFRDAQSNYERFDLINYVCGETPRQRNRTTWMSTSQPHTNYSGNRKLEVVEMHLHNVEALINEVYGVQIFNE